MAIRLVQAGYAVYGIDYEGHGKSSGKRCYISSFDCIVSDCFNHFKSVCGTAEYPFSCVSDVFCLININIFQQKIEIFIQKR
jgi:Serine aminopeptidase, S33